MLINDWCQQYPSHSIGDLAFGPGPSHPLYVSGGEGASFNTTDYGQLAPATPAATRRTASAAPRTRPAPRAARFAARARAGRPVSPGRSTARSCESIRQTGDGLPGNPFADSSDANARRIIAYGFRNPFRFALRYGELWVGDVGWTTIEEIDRIVSPGSSPAPNFGWPCYEGPFPQPSYRAAGLNLCQSLYATPGGRDRSVLQLPAQRQGRPRRDLSDGKLLDERPRVLSQRRAVSGELPRRALLRRLLAQLHLGDAEGEREHPRPQSRQDLRRGRGASGRSRDRPGRRTSTTSTSRTGRSCGSATPPATRRRPRLPRRRRPRAPCPSTVHFDASGSSDPDPGDTLTYAWDLDGDGAYDDSTAQKPSFTYTDDGRLQGRTEGHRPRRGVGNRHGRRSRRATPRRPHDHRPAVEPQVGRRRPDRVQGLGDRCAGRDVAGIDAVVDGACSTTALRTATSMTFRASTGLPAARSTPRTTSTPRISSFG